MFLRNFLYSLPFVVQFFVIFIISFFVDIFYVFWVRKTVDRNAIKAANYSVMIFLCSSITILGIIEINNILLLAAILGFWLGTFLGIKLYD